MRQWIKAGALGLALLLPGAADAAGDDQPSSAQVAVERRINEALDRGEFKTAAELVEPFARGGDPKAQALLGVLYLNGRGVPQDFARAFELFRSAADQGEVNSQLEVGKLYLAGAGVSKSEVKAASYFLKASQQGAAEAQFELGKLFDPGYFEGDTPKITILRHSEPTDSNLLEKDAAKAAHFYQLAADKGVKSAQYNLGNFYANGIGVPQNFSEAAKFYKMAAVQGVTMAMINLGHLYNKGLGVKQNRIRAYAWSLLGAVTNDPQALINKDVLASELTRTQRAEAEHLAKLCVDSEYRNCD